MKEKEYISHWACISKENKCIHGIIYKDTTGYCCIRIYFCLQNILTCYVL